MRVAVSADAQVKSIAQWINDNISEGYAFVPNDTHLLGHQYRAYNREWLVLHEIDEHFRQWCKVEGLDEEHEVMLCLSLDLQ